LNSGVAKRLLCFVGRQGHNAERVDIGMHHVGYRAIHKLVPGHGAQSRKTRGDYADTVMTFAIAGTYVPGVQMTIIGNIEPSRLQAGG
jgi:hypothetical protein